MAKMIDGRLAYADRLRAFAILAVVLLHISANYMDASAATSAAWTTAAVYNSLTRWSVPVFIMLSGMFLLDPKKSLPLPVLFFRHILRLAVALLVWGTLYAMVDLAAAGAALTWDNMFSTFLQVLRGNTHYHLWYLYMLLGLYLVTPVLRAFTRGATRAEFHYALLFGLLLFLNALLQVFWPSSTIALYLQRMEIYLFMGYTCCYVAGYYFRHYTIGRVAEILFYLLGAAGLAVTVLGTLYLSHRDGAQNMTLAGYTTPNVLLTAVALVVLFRYAFGPSEERSRNQSVAVVARTSFGIYLVHDLFILLLRHFGLFALPIPAAVAIPLWTAVVFLLSFCVAWPIHKIPFVGRYLS